MLPRTKSTYGHLFGTCSRHVDHSGGHFCFFLAYVVDMSIILAAPIMTTSESAANSTATMSVTYRQRLNGPNVKSTSGWTAGCSQFVVLLRGPGEQPGMAEQHTNDRSGHHRRGAMLSYNSPSLGFWTNQYQREQKLLDGRRQPRYARGAVSVMTRNVCLLADRT